MNKMEEYLHHEKGKTLKLLKNFLKKMFSVRCFTLQDSFIWRMKLKQFTSNTSHHLHFASSSSNNISKHV
ncbi:CLUMA_CG006441, isoform A [Clunio marinus]|uniref:CLUMA_CG006441, isoform A n=1 Tax=Clunio marinus TaxID=568069 RepID=A0A1J1I3B6_9DIPT|nr:CLUMA_CG006441, isoform A [Clunio marinus]